MKTGRKLLNFVIWIAILVVVGLFLAAIWYSTSRAGFGFSKKTLMDWIELLIIPVTLAGAAFLFNKFEKDRERESTIDQRREDAIQLYFDKVTDIIRNSKELSEEDLVAIRIRTFTALRSLDGERKAFVVKFLFDLGLITMRYEEGGEKHAPSISLSGADLRGASFHGVDFYVKNYIYSSPTQWTTIISEIDLSGSDLRNANFEGANLYRTNFSNANLERANLRGVNASSANFVGADFSNANLQNIYLGNGSLQGAKFINANCYKANFWYADFFSTEYPNGGDPFVGKADFSGADLRYADFNDANILPDQIKMARFFWKTRLPNFSLFSGYHPLFTVLIGNTNEVMAMGISRGDLQGGICGCKESITVDSQKIIDEKSKEVSPRGKPVQFDPNVEVLKELWKEYRKHRLKKFAKNSFTKIVYVLLEYDPVSYVAGYNFIQRKIWDIGQGIKFWKKYEKTKGFTL